MLYMFEVDLLVAIMIFALAGSVLLTVMALTWAKDYVRTHLTRHTVAGESLTEPIRQSC